MRGCLPSPFTNAISPFPQVVLHTGTQTATSSTAPTVVPALQVASGFDWNGNAAATDDDDASSESENEATTTTAPSKRRKGKAPQADHTAELASKAPESSADFERALLGSPNSSYLWVQFMSFQLELSEVDKARQIGRRALESIAYREEEEKLNVWIALLNLENMHGTSQSLDKLFKEAVQYNDAKTVHLRMAAILERTEKPEAAEEIYQKAVKKFSQSSKVWTLFAEFCFHRGEVDVARALLPRSLKSLPARKRESSSSLGDGGGGPSADPPPPPLPPVQTLKPSNDSPSSSSSSVTPNEARRSTRA